MGNESGARLSPRPRIVFSCEYGPESGTDPKLRWGPGDHTAPGVARPSYFAISAFVVTAPSNCVVVLTKYTPEPRPEPLIRTS